MHIQRAERSEVYKTAGERRTGRRGDAETGTAAAGCKDPADLLQCDPDAGGDFFAVVYSAEVRTEQEKADLDNFCSTVETMKQISVRYLDTELDDARDWAAYIQRENMTEDEAPEYLRAVNTWQDRIAHIVDMDTFGARSSYLRRDGDQIETYRKFAGGTDTFSGRIVENLRRLYNGQLAVVGRYRVAETQMTVISVGTRVDLRQEDGSTKGYLLLRVIPVESMRKIWIFPTDDPKAEIGLITADGDYVIPSAAMRSENFLEFIRSYNFADDYNGANDRSGCCTVQLCGSLFFAPFCDKLCPFVVQ